MLETFIILFAVVASFYIESVFISLIILFFAVLLALPGIYSMIFGAPFISTTKKKKDIMV